MPDHKATMLRLYDEVISGGNLALAGEFIARDVVEHEAFPGSAPGLEGFKELFTMMRSAFPDLHMTAEDMIAEGDKVVVRYTMRGTHKGEFAGLAATGKRVEVAGIDIVRLAGGKIVEHWGVSDQLSMMQQLGAVPAEP